MFITYLNELAINNLMIYCHDLTFMFGYENHATSMYD